MKTVVIIILAGIVALPIVSWALYGNMGEILPWFGLLALLALVVIFVNRSQGKRWF